MTYQIDHGMERPASKSKGEKGGRKPIYPFAKMRIGDSFFVSTQNLKETQNAITGASYRHRPMRFSTRQVIENQVAGVRCWRIA